MPPGRLYQVVLWVLKNDMEDTAFSHCMSISSNRGSLTSQLLFLVFGQEDADMSFWRVLGKYACFEGRVNDSAGEATMISMGIDLRERWLFAHVSRFLRETLFSVTLNISALLSSASVPMGAIGG